MATHKALAAMTCLALCTMWAQAQNRVQGNWEGKFTGGDLNGTPISAQIIGESDSEYRVQATIGGDTEVQFRGKTENAMTTFYGGVDLGEDRGGRYAVTAIADAGAMEGVFRQGLKPGSAFALTRVEKGSPTLGQQPPQGAVPLMQDSMEQWVLHPDPLALRPEGFVEITSPGYRTRDEFGSGLYHVEFRTPYMPNARGQGRGNSGVYVLGRYEVQVLDSFGLPPADNEAGGIYRRATPLVNASLPPEEWQTYDIEFTAPQFDAAGAKTANARITVRHNGIVIHDDVELSDLTAGGVSGTEAAQGPLFLQHHGDRVRYRNIWFLPKQ
jgi:hypothetical protein